MPTIMRICPYRFFSIQMKRVNHPMFMLIIWMEMRSYGWNQFFWHQTKAFLPSNYEKLKNSFENTDFS